MGACNLKRFVRLCCGVVLVIAVLASAGCARWQPFQSAEGGSPRSWLMDFFPSSGLNGTGYTSKAQEIERNLGF